MALVDTRGYQLNPNIMGGLQSGMQFGAAVAERDRQEAIRGLVAQQQGGQVATQDGGVVTSTRPAMSQEEMARRARAIDPIHAEKVLTSMGLDDASKRAEMSRFAAQLQSVPYLQRDGYIQARAEKLKSEGRDPTETLKLSGIPEAQQDQALLGVQMMDLSTKERFAIQAQQARGRQATQKAFAPITIVNEAGEKRLVSPTVDNLTGKAKLEPFAIPEGFRISKETDEEKRAANVLAEGAKAKQKVQAKGQAQRQQLSIDRGLEAADGFANVQRALDLLDQVETGGIDRVSLGAKRFFGVEGADEAELSNRMGKAVLSQLRATFGAAFTAKEGESLAIIEAGFGKSTEGNKRLLEQTKRLILRAAKRGIRAAREQGDTATMRDIQEALKFRLGEAPPEEAELIQPETNLQTMSLEQLEAEAARLRGQQ